MKSPPESDGKTKVEEGIEKDAPLEMTGVMIDVEDKMGIKARIGLALSAKIPILPSAKSAIAAKPTDPGTVEEETKEIQMEEAILGRRLETGTAPSAKIRISPSATSVTSVKRTSLVLMLSPELKVDSGVEILDHKLVVLNEDEVGHQEVPADNVDLDSEALGVAVREVTDPEEVVVGAEFGPPQHSSCLNPSTTYGEQGGYALG